MGERPRSARDGRVTITTKPGSDPDLAATLHAFDDERYRDAYWPARRYEDRCDRIALRALLPAYGARLLEVGAGFGRLADEYEGYREVVLLDASPALLEQAHARIAGDTRFSVVAGDAFGLPFADASFDAVVCVRVIHHFRDPRPAIDELARVLRPGGVLVLETANKRNLKSIAGYLLGRRPSPLSRGSEPYTELILLPRAAALDDLRDSGPTAGWTSSTSNRHHPDDVRRWLRTAGLEVNATRSVGIFRTPAVSRRVPLPMLIRGERIAQVTLAPVTAGPSLFMRAMRAERRR